MRKYYIFKMKIQNKLIEIITIEIISIVIKMIFPIIKVILFISFLIIIKVFSMEFIQAVLLN